MEVIGESMEDLFEKECGTVNLLEDDVEDEDLILDDKGVVAAMKHIDTFYKSTPDQEE